MDFQLSEDQEGLQQATRAFCDGRVPSTRLAELEQAGGFDRALWGELAEMGVFGLRLPADAGGIGLGCADAVLVFAELGRRLVPGPILFSHLAAGLVDGAAAGDTVVGALDGRGGEPFLVEHLDPLDVLLVVGEDGIERLDPKSLTALAVATPLDPLTPVHHIAALPTGERIAGPEAAERFRLDGGALAAATLLGIAESTLELAVDYAKEREQFGRPIGSFQAVKHILADMFVRLEVARAAVYAAGATIDQPEVGDPARAVAAAKLVASEAARKNSRACIQVFGGMGYTWEIPAHYYLKRTWVLDSAFGTETEHADTFARHLEARPPTD
jgi:alkylation response protein AidB-like acyl-CoA dehydrogenase